VLESRSLIVSNVKILPLARENPTESQSGSSGHQSLVLRAEDEGANLIDSHSLLSYFQEANEVNSFMPEDPENFQLRYSKFTKQVNVALFLQPKEGPSLQIRDSDSGSSFSSMANQLTFSYASIVHSNDDLDKDGKKGLSDGLKAFLLKIVRLQLGIKSVHDIKREFMGVVEFEDMRREKGLSARNPSEVYRSQQRQLLSLEAMRNFKQIIDLLKINKLESDELVYKNLNTHSLVAVLHDELLGVGPEDTVGRETLFKLGLLYETKKMNPPYFFSWEFMAGTYAPFLMPFLIALVQISFRLFKEKRQQKQDEVEKEKTE